MDKFYWTEAVVRNFISTLIMIPIPIVSRLEKISTWILLLKNEKYPYTLHIVGMTNSYKSMIRG